MIPIRPAGSGGVLAAPGAGLAGAAPGVSEPPPLALYVHLPWCIRKCPYCDFNSHEFRDGDSPPEDRYVDALIADLESALPSVWGRSVQTVFIGGGTPSLFSPEAIERLLAAVRARLRLAPGAEVTMEANPGTFEAARFRGYAQAGVTRLSIGVQSFSNDALAALGRIHDAGQARRAIETAIDAFETFNIDLMYALPGQSLDALRADLREALAFAPPHLSVYHLTLEPNTLFARRPPPLPDDDLAADMQALVEDETGAAGLRHYEVSAYAREGHRCRHNLNYWQFGDYLGIGAGAHGKLSFHDRIVREARLRHPRAYMSGALDSGAIEVSRTLAAAELPFEFMLNALRLLDGVPAALFVERTGLSLAAISRELQRAADRGLLDPDPTVIRATPLGMRFLNDLIEGFLRD
ncbi:radical SAM family heme chaperone HemW [Zeimonas arvi]|uniref:radical SAM family heme chaperone HemW n=1 Tax=Zeimonas arvi TaxID=2498847 RepID=UPI0038999F94